MPCYSPLKGYKDEETGGLVFRRDDTKETMEVSCGQCIGCRLDRSRMWAMRITHECSLYEDSGGNSFVTLTYRNKETCTREQLANGFHIRDDWSLDEPKKDEFGKQVESSHFQKFMKRLRKSRPGAKLKYYHCGEYGNICRHGIDLDAVKCPLCNVGRPHYHAILFNCSFNDLEAYATQNGVTRYTSPELEDIWKYGYVDVGKVTFQSAAYTARYIMKKINGDQAEEHYQNITELGEIQPLVHEYSSMSNGIGLEWFKKYKDDMFPSDEVPVVGQGVIKKVPRYYTDRMAEENEAIVEEVKRLRQVFRKENAEEYTPERLISKYKVKKAQVSLLGRTL